jgi:hypothetical protein
MKTVLLLKGEEEVSLLLIYSVLSLIDEVVHKVSGTILHLFI